MAVFRIEVHDTSSEFSCTVYLSKNSYKVHLVSYLCIFSECHFLSVNSQTGRDLIFFFFY